MRTTDPNSPMQRAKPRAEPVRMAGARLGNTILRSTAGDDAPSEAAASSMSRSSSSSTGWTERTTNGNVMKSSAKTMPACEYATLTLKGLRGPYSARSVKPATIVGRAKGRSMSALMTGLPGKSSRTRTQAMSVPIRALMTTTRSDRVKVRRSAGAAPGAP